MNDKQIEKARSWGVCERHIARMARPSVNFSTVLYVEHEGIKEEWQPSTEVIKEVLNFVLEIFKAKAISKKHGLKESVIAPAIRFGALGQFNRYSLAFWIGLYRICIDWMFETQQKTTECLNSIQTKNEQ